MCMNERWNIRRLDSRPADQAGEPTTCEDAGSPDDGVVDDVLGGSLRTRSGGQKRAPLTPRPKRQPAATEPDHTVFPDPIFGGGLSEKL